MKNKGDKNGMWKGDKVGYNAIHSWLSRNFGKANHCEHCLSKKAKKYEYALLKGKNYERKKENFIQLCTPCHVIYDGKIAILNKAVIKNVVAYKDGVELNFNSIKEAIKTLNILPSAISNNLKGRSKTAGGYKWRYV